MPTNNVSVCRDRGSNSDALLRARDFKRPAETRQSIDNGLSPLQNGEGAVSVSTNDDSQRHSIPDGIPSQETRWCVHCERDLPLSSFGLRTKRGKRVPQPYCRPCMVAYHTEWRTTKGAEKFATAAKDSRLRYPERDKARDVLQYAVKSGKLVRGACVFAGPDCRGGIDGHHDDYSKPLDVQWVCRAHHRGLDRARVSR